MKQITLLITIMMVALFLSACTTTDVTNNDDLLVNETVEDELALEEKQISLEETCTTNDGTWIESAQECEYISKDLCESLGGAFNECASACRNDPAAEICTMQCVLVCEFNSKEEAAPRDVGIVETHTCSDDEKVQMACTREYMPVCGDDGATYSNGCTACGSGNIDSWNLGSC